MSDVENWSEAAAQWIAWVRTDNHDAFWAYQSAFEAFVGRGTGAAIELGAGEGRISRVLGALGWRMTLVEPVAELQRAAEAARSAVVYHAAPAHAVPAEAAQFDLVVLYNMLMDVDDLDGTIAEARRLLHPDGRVIAGIVHPIADVVHAREEGDPSLPYFEARQVDETMQRDGLTMRFHGWRRPLCDYVNALARAGLVITRMAEPAPDPVHPATQRLDNGRVMPIFLWLELRPFSAP
ncbi:MAG: methyltransferase domain-containing protein [Pseudomonadota bacterium]